MNLKAGLESAAATSDSSLQISALNDANYELRRLLIALHIHMEQQKNEVAEKQIWRVLTAMADRRLLTIARSIIVKRVALRLSLAQAASGLIGGGYTPFFGAWLA